MRWIALSLVVALAGCAGPRPQVDMQVYQSPSPVPATFDLEVAPLPGGKYQFDGKAHTLSDLYWKIQNDQHTNRPTHTLLYHLDPKTPSICGSSPAHFLSAASSA